MSSMIFGERARRTAARALPRPDLEGGPRPITEADGFRVVVVEVEDQGGGDYPFCHLKLFQVKHVNACCTRRVARRKALLYVIML